MLLFFSFDFFSRVSKIVDPELARRECTVLMELGDGDRKPDGERDPLTSLDSSSRDPLPVLKSVLYRPLKV